MGSPSSRDRATHESYTRPIELFDLGIDQSEKNNVADQNPAIVTRIARIMEAARSESKEFPIAERSA